MKTINFIVVGILCLIGSSMPAQGAEMIGKNYPYYIFQDKDVVRWCMDPANYAKKTTCWTMGVATTCDVLPPEQGYIDCKANESTN